MELSNFTKKLTDKYASCTKYSDTGNIIQQAMLDRYPAPISATFSTEFVRGSLLKMTLQSTGALKSKILFCYDYRKADLEYEFAGVPKVVESSTEVKSVFDTFNSATFGAASLVPFFLVNNKRIAEPFDQYAVADALYDDDGSGRQLIAITFKHSSKDSSLVVWFDPLTQFIIKAKRTVSIAIDQALGAVDEAERLMQQANPDLVVPAAFIRKNIQASNLPESYYEQSVYTYSDVICEA